VVYLPSLIFAWSAVSPNADTRFEHAEILGQKYLSRSYSNQCSSVVWVDNS